jgi:hypothetical protein
MMVRPIIIATVVLWLLAIAGISQADAAQLPVTTTTQVKEYTLSKCASAALGSAVAGTSANEGAEYSSVEVSEIPAACEGLPLDMTLHSADGTVLASGSGTTSGAATIVATGTYDHASVSAVIARIDGWLFSTTWTAPAPPAPQPAVTCVAINPSGNATGQSCTVAFSYGVVGYNPWPDVSAYGINFTVTTGASNWQIRIDFADTSGGFPGWTPTYVGTNGNPESGSCSGAVFTGVKNSTWGSDSGYVVARNDGGSYGTQLCP